MSEIVTTFKSSTIEYAVQQPDGAWVCGWRGRGERNNVHAAQGRSVSDTVEGATLIVWADVEHAAERADLMLRSAMALGVQDYDAKVMERTVTVERTAFTPQKAF